MTPPTDTQMLDWLSKQEAVSFERHYNGVAAKRTPRERRTDGYNGHIDFFSISSQHMTNVPTLREAITRAMKRKRTL